MDEAEGLKFFWKKHFAFFELTRFLEDSKIFPPEITFFFGQFDG